MSKAIIAIIITASVATFRRAGFGFTDKGTAFSHDFFSEEQRAAIDAEPRLSVKEVSVDAIPEGVAISPELAAQISAAEDEKTPAPKTPAPKTKPAAKKPASGEAKNKADGADA